MHVVIVDRTFPLVKENGPVEVLSLGLGLGINTQIDEGSSDKSVHGRVRR